INVMHLQHHTQVRGHSSAAHRLTGRMLRRMKHLSGAIDLGRIQPGSQHIVMTRLCNQHRAGEPTIYQSLDYRLAARLGNAEAGEASGHRHVTGIQPSYYSVRRGSEADVAVLE